MSTGRYDPLAQPRYNPGNEAVGEPSALLQIARLQYRMDQLERRISLTDRPTDAPIETAVWGDGLPGIGISPAWRVRFGGNLYEFDIDARIPASSGTTTVELYLNNSLVATANLTSGQVQADPVTVTGVRCAQGDQLWVSTTALGSGILGLGAQARMAA